MTANLNFPSIKTFSPNGGNVALNPTSTDGDPKSEDFAAVLTGQMFKAERQGLAAQVSDGPSLQVVSLGTKLNVITTDEPLPDLSSLATFARAQGLDELAIQALFGPNIGPKSDVAVGGQGQTSALGVASAAPVWQFSHPKLSSALFPEPVGRLDDASRPENSGLDLALAGPFGPPVRTTEQAGAKAEPMGITIGPWVSLGSTDTNKVAQAQPDMRFNAGAEEFIQDAVRLSITMPVKDITKRPPNAAVTTEAINWSAMFAGPSAHKAGAGQVWDSLHLTVPEGFDLDVQSVAVVSRDQDPVTAPGAPQPSDGSAAKPGANAAHPMRSEAATIAAQTELRAVQQQQLADRLGEAAAHRLIAQIERGEWKMQMRLEPGKLGKIDVELTMHTRGLEALFSADSALTRELLTQGTNRLKETLNQAGMTLASVTVNGDQARQSGGNSTPQRGNQPNADTRPVKARAEVSAAGAETSSPRTYDGLNILA